MSDYLVSGKKGSGKTLFCIGVIRDTLKSGKRVATNIDLHLDKLLPPHSRMMVSRLPDRPTVDDMVALGRGQEGVVEEDNGIIVLDETGTFFNSRNWNDKGRQALLDWFVHSRKYGWDSYFIAQGQEQLDKQIRSTQLEYHISVKNTSKWKVPIVSAITEMLFGIPVKLPKIHMGIIKHGLERDSLFIGRRWYRGIDLYDAYDTQQIFYEREHQNSCGLYTVLSPWHIKGRYMGWLELYKPILMAGLGMGLILGAIFGGGFGYRFATSKIMKPPEIAVDSSVKVVGKIREGSFMSLMLSDGRVMPMRGERTDAGGHFYRVGDKWVKAD